MNKRLISLTLFAAILLGCTVCTACGDNGEKEDGGVITTTNEETTEKPFLDSLGEYDFEGAECTFLVRETRINDFFPEESIGDVVNDAIYDRNNKIASRFNVEIKTVTLPDVSNDWNTVI